jgi:hypothetical protein
MPKTKKNKTVKSKPKAKKVSKTKKVSKPKKAEKKKNVNNKVLVIPETVEEVEIIEIDTEEKPDRYEEHACGFVNEAECEEDLEEDGLDVEEVEKDHFTDDEE